MITGRTKVYALLGHPVVHSPSPRLHNRWFGALGLDAVYVALPTTAPTAGQAMRSLGLAGANVTTPLKETMLDAVDRLESSARTARAVNTLWWDGDQLVGANTDGAGFVRALEAADVDPRGARMTIVGAGGAARGIAVACLDAGVASLTVVNRTPARARTLLDDLSRHWPDTPMSVRALAPDAVRGAELVAVTVRADLDLDPALTATGCHWVDITTGPLPASAQRARTAGCSTTNGMGMLVWQAALAFQRWTGLEPPLVSTDFAQS